VKKTSVEIYLVWRYLV